MSFKRRDFLVDKEERVRALWKGSTCNEAEAHTQKPPFFVTFPIPYMNGRLHLGHAFSMTKAEYTARFQRLLGKNVLWPFAFHGTGMPIAACADKLRNELEAGEEATGNSVPDEPDDSTELTFKAEPTYASKKSKAVSKSGGSATQKDILLTIGVQEEDIPKFANPHHWLRYFPPIGVEDLRRFGVSVDWRRTFLTTELNPYFDRFVKWQYRTLLKRDRIKFGLRPAVFSRIDNQPCADHDRASGEGSNPQEYTLLKIKVNNVPATWLERCPELVGKNVYLVAATLRPETTYAQTNCFVLPSGEYDITPAFTKPLTMEDLKIDQKGYLASKIMERDEAIRELSDVYVCSYRSACNMSYQGIIPLAPVGSSNEKFNVHHTLLRVKGKEMIGLSLRAPKTLHEEIFALPLPSIKMDKGTGIVMSVPSDAPDDYAMLKDLQEKEKLRAEFGVKPEWCAKEIIEVVDIPGFGRRAAVTLCEEKKVGSWKDEQKLQEIKKLVYQKGFYEGVMLLGSCKGKLVKDAKSIIGSELIEEGSAVSYLEPERKVVSRSNDECVVALCNQWYSDFGDPEWKALVRRHVENEESFNAHGQRQLYLSVIEWLQGWACSRNYGLGTLLPWEAEHGNRVLIESLSDSTIYFAYYTVCHFWHGDMYAQTPGLLGIKPDDLTDDAFDYIFAQTDVLPAASTIHAEKLQVMRDAFEYWYPMNLRVSGKDLIANHLTMSLFHHAAMWPSRPDLWPKGFFVNGHVMLDSEKMSKSTGNFLGMDEAIDLFSADATRLALADAGDGVDDANFERQTANGCLMKLYLVVSFIQETLQKKQGGHLRSGELRDVDRMICNEIIILTSQAKNAYATLCMRDALKYAFYEFISLKDTYRNLLPPDEELHQDTILKWIETFAVIISPIACHNAEYIWSILLEKGSFVGTQRWPEFLNSIDAELHRKFELLLESCEDARKALEKFKSKDGSQAKHLEIFVAKEYLPWQQEVIKVLQKLEYDTKTNLPLNPRYIDVVRGDEMMQTHAKADPKQFKSMLAFASYTVKEEVRHRGPDAALSLQLTFDEGQLLREHEEFIRRSLGGLESVVVSAEAPSSDPNGLKRATAVPGRPSYLFTS